MTSEDKTNVNPAAAEAAEKPKRGRGRPRKTTDAEQPTDQAMPFGTAADISLETITEHDGAAKIEDTPSPTTEVSTPTVSYGSGCGNVLKAAREAQGLSIHEVCSQLRLGIKQIQAIEQDDFEKLPQPSIVRGFIRNYARLLNIDVQPILEAYQRIVPNKAPLPLSVRSNASPSVIDKPARVFRPQRLLTFLIFLVLTGIAAYFYINHIKPQALKDASLALDVEEISDTTGQEIPIPAPEVAPATGEHAPAAPVTENVDSSTTTTQPVEATTQQTTPAASAEPSMPPAQNTVTDNTVVSTPTPASNQVAESTTLKATDPQKANLVFKVSEDSWVRIEDMQGKKVFSEVLPAGSERQVNTEKPVNITVGHAASTQLTIDNQPYDLTQATRGRVARIQLK